MAAFGSSPRNTQLFDGFPTAMFARFCYTAEDRDYLHPDAQATAKTPELHLAARRHTMRSTDTA